MVICNHVVDRSGKEEAGLRNLVVFSFDDLAKSPDRFRQRHIDAVVACKLLRHMEGLGKETLDFPRAVHDQAVFLGKLIHTHDRDDILKLLIALQHLLDGARYPVVLLADDFRRKNSGGGVQRINSRENTERGDLAVKNRCRVQMRKGRRRRGVCQIVRRDVDSLDGGNGAVPGRRDSLLQRRACAQEARILRNPPG